MALQTERRATKRITLLGILVSFALILSIVERWFPLEAVVPLPGIKLGLPNIVTLFALFYLDIPSALIIIFLRTFLASVFMGSITALAFSLTGGLMAFAAMRLALKLYPKYLSIGGVSIIGAAFHNFGQICAAMVVMGTVNVFGYLPLLLIASIVTGFLIGAVFGAVVKKLASIRSIQAYLRDASMSSTSRPAMRFEPDTPQKDENNS